ncbi:hypothetical protein LPB72_07410 [Hydrogenophaga crassostreae]|uniref:Uncharacterized protein n=1 Tax=Hydrogenophaga crassostreae TaxID=1763535 RepID=A0A167IGV8_9BURK|nr:hypothetical protein [Hydrogenophaga crassostreae]AOW13128.1 hypothetical protein LPB072_09960 [Hydrogenophaga crassostreae]OAD42727.1 hypothetical protein LPB72_07410 [Hydrogenophaga crassostreae]
MFRGLLKSELRIGIDHPILGELQLEQGKNGSYWLSEAFQDDDITVSIDTVDVAPPSDEQVEFRVWVTENLASIYDSVSSEMDIQHLGMHRKPVEADWRKTFRFAGFDVPIQGKIGLPWELAFECLTDDSGFIYTCHFENTSLVHTSFDT